MSTSDSKVAGAGDDDAHYAALRARDTRFDGLVYVGVTSTGVYCRPICPARTPARSRCHFFRSAAAAERAGYRACLRCRPELAPGAAPVDASSRLGAMAIARIDRGFMNDRSVGELAESLGVSDRHLRRVLMRELGITPIGLAQTRRLAIAKQLLQDTRLPLGEIAFTAGFGSIRRFNAAFSRRFGRAPSSIRRFRGRASEREQSADAITVRLDYRPPLDWSAMIDFVAARAMVGLERVDGDTYHRRVGNGALEVSLDPLRPALRVRISSSLTSEIADIAVRVRRLFDLDAHPARIGERLAQDPMLAPRVARRPGLRVPGAFDPFETAVRAILGQQISVRAATTIAARLVTRFGAPRAEVLAGAAATELRSIGLTRARAETLIGLARAVADGRVTLTPRDPEGAIRDLEALPGIGPWTAQYIAMRAMAWPDAFPATDLGIRRALGTGSRRAIEERAAAWSPWRAYAAMYLWQA